MMQLKKKAKLTAFIAQCTALLRNILISAEVTEPVDFCCFNMQSHLNRIKQTRFLGGLGLQTKLEGLKCKIMNLSTYAVQLNSIVIQCFSSHKS